MAAARAGSLQVEERLKQSLALFSAVGPLAPAGACPPAAAHSTLTTTL